MHNIFFDFFFFPFFSCYKVRQMNSRLSSLKLCACKVIYGLAFNTPKTKNIVFSSDFAQSRLTLVFYSLFVVPFCCIESF